MFFVGLFLILLGVLLSFIAGMMFGNVTFTPSIDALDKQVKNQLSQLQNQNLRYRKELRILNKKHRRSKLLGKKFQKERDVLKQHIGMDVAMPLIKALYPEGKLSYLHGEENVNP